MHVPYLGLNSKVNDLKFFENNVLSLGTGRGEAFRTAFSAERSKILSPLLLMTVATITSPPGNNLTRIVHFNPLDVERGLIQLVSTLR